MEILSRHQEVAESIGYIDLSQRDLSVVPQFLQRFKVCYFIHSINCIFINENVMTK